MRVHFSNRQRDFSRDFIYESCDGEGETAYKYHEFFKARIATARISHLRHNPTPVYLQLRMGFYYRKSVGLGPFRVNISKSGIGYSVGGAGFRTGVSAGGRRYTTFGIPGTGVGYRTSSSGSGKGCLFVLVALFGLAVLITKILL